MNAIMHIKYTTAQTAPIVSGLEQLARKLETVLSLSLSLLSSSWLYLQLPPVRLADVLPLQPNFFERIAQPTNQRKRPRERNPAESQTRNQWLPIALENSVDQTRARADESAEEKIPAGGDLLRHGATAAGGYGPVHIGTQRRLGGFF